MSTNASGEAELVFGRKTYEMMARFWPSKEAAQAMPEVARGMNRMRKTVFSHTLKAADWENSRVAPGRPRHRNPPDERRAGPNLLILGSGEIVAQLTQAGLDRRLPARRRAHRARQRTHVVRRRHRQAAPRAHEDARVFQRQRCGVV
jgi:dihydrofolate reductase